MSRAVAGLLLVVLPAAAAASEPQVDGYYSGRIVVTDHAEGSEGAAPTAGPGRQVFSYWRLMYTAQGYCRVRQFTTDESLARAYDYLNDRRGAEANAGLDFPECARDVVAAPVPDPGQLARDFWDVRLLPSPTLLVTPDWAMVGSRVYLRIEGSPATSFEVPNPIGAPVAITATSRYVVDWGDGSPPVTTTSRGGPWPDGDLTHVYRHAAEAVTIRVAQQWSATWTAGPGSAGTLENLRTDGELTLRVDQVQPVRNK